MKKILMVTLLPLFLVGCDSLESYPVNNTPPVNNSISKSMQAVLDEGYTDPVKDGAPLFKCSKDDSLLMSDTYKAKNSNGKEVVLHVCCGLLKGCTVRH